MGLWLQSVSSVVSVTDGRTDGRNLDPLVSLHLGGLHKNQKTMCTLTVYLFQNKLFLWEMSGLNGGKKSSPVKAEFLHLLWWRSSPGKEFHRGNSRFERNVENFPSEMMSEVNNYHRDYAPFPLHATNLHSGAHRHSYTRAYTHTHTHLRAHIQSTLPKSNLLGLKK